MAHETKPSKTALIVSQAILFKSFDGRFKSYCVEETVIVAQKLISKFHMLKGFWIVLLRISAFRWLAEKFESFILPGFMNHVLIRKWWIEKTIKEILSERAGYFINVGAGFDGLAWSLAQANLVNRSIEMDIEQTQSIKRTLIPANVIRFHSLDWEKLKGEIGQGDSPIVFLLEGVSMYLSETEIKNLLTTLASLNNQVPCYLIATAMETNQDGIAHFYGSSNLLGYWLKKISEPFSWGISQEALPRFLHDCGWQIDEIANTSELVKTLNLNIKTAKGEYLFLAKNH